MTIASWLLTAAFAACLFRAHHRLVLVARASHELRGPLSAVQLGLHGLSGEPARMAAIELELRRARRALEDLAAARSGARVRTGPERVDLAALVREHEGAWRALAAAHGAPLRVAPPIVVLPFAVGGGDPAAPLTVLADPLRVAQACANLVGNAAEHGRGEIRVRVRAASDRVAIEVADEGPGLPAPLTAMTAPARLRRGRRGHGLAIAASIAAHHGGRLSADGPRMSFELPAAGAPVALTRRARVRAAVRRLAGAPAGLTRLARTSTVLRGLAGTPAGLTRLARTSTVLRRLAGALAASRRRVRAAIRDLTGAPASSRRLARVRAAIRGLIARSPVREAARLDIGAADQPGVTAPRGAAFSPPAEGDDPGLSRPGHAGIAASRAAAVSPPAEGGGADDPLAPPGEAGRAAAGDAALAARDRSVAS